MSLLAAAMVLGSTACASVTSAPTSELVLETSQGPIVIALETETAPRTSEFVAGLAEAGELDGHSFYRAGAAAGSGAPIELVEGGLLDDFVLGNTPTSIAASGLPTLAVLETTAQTGLTHRRGAVSMARDVLESGVVIPDLVIYLADAPEYDSGGQYSPDKAGYPVFGTVVSGMSIVDQLAGQNREGTTWVPLLKGQILTEPLRIEQAYIRNTR